MSKPEAPCLNCINRKYKCHSMCEAYKQFRYENDLYNKKVQKEQKKKTDWYIYQNKKYRNCTR